ncbi:helix-turn-helix transcriptional regulator [Candidatus Micrarchaeota archaeon]|nr:helix-turn-helix transcriptional regulator [Candidatus Micrarchaeota archaeon]
MPVKLSKSPRTTHPMASCPVLTNIELIERKWMLPLLLEFFSSKKRQSFSTLQRGLQPITAKILARRLDELQAHGYVNRVEKGARVTYAPTRKSSMLRGLVAVLKKYRVACSEADRERCATCSQRDRCVAAYG